MTDPMADIMQQDSTIDETPDFGIMSGYVKAKVWNTYTEALGPRRARGDAHGEALETALEEGAPRAMYAPLVALADAGWLSEVVYDLPKDDSIVFELWDYFTKDDVSQERKLEVARAWYKRQLRGCIGVQPSGILRANLKDYSGEDPEELPSYDVYAGTN